MGMNCVTFSKNEPHSAQSMLLLSDNRYSSLPHSGQHSTSLSISSLFIGESPGSDNRNNIIIKFVIWFDRVTGYKFPDNSILVEWIAVSPKIWKYPRIMGSISYIGKIFFESYMHKSSRLCELLSYLYLSSIC